jgi:cytochrome c-type biogenesis protein CcmH
MREVEISFSLDIQVGSTKLVSCMKSFNSFRIITLSSILLFVLLPGNTFSQTTTTNTTLTDPQHIETFLDVTERVRCICLPSLPIKGCTYNVCVVSSYLKTFIENRIREGMTGDEIVDRFVHGFGDSIQNDSVVQHFKREGNQGMIQSLTHGFGEKIQAKPDSTWINLSLGLIGILALTGIGYYLVQRTRAKSKPLNDSKSNTEKLDTLEKKYLSEL